MFLTLEDPRAKVQGSRDPLGTQPAWYWFGRRLVGNLTTVSNSTRGFTTLLLARYYTERLIDDGRAKEEDALPIFLRFEQIAAYGRHVGHGIEGEIRGIDRVKRILAEEGPKVPIGVTSGALLSDQKTYGLWGLFSVPARASGLIADGPVGLTARARDFIDAEYSGRLRKVESELVRLLTKDGRLDTQKNRPFFSVLASIFSPSFTGRERTFYGEVLRDGCYVTTLPERRQQVLASLVGKFTDLEARVDRKDIETLAKRADAEDHRISRRLRRVGRLEALIAPSEVVFAYLQTKNGQRPAQLARDLANRWGRDFPHLRSLPFDDIRGELETQLGSELTATMQRADKVLAGGKYEDAILTLLDWNRLVMKRRGAAPWIRLDNNGKLDVRYRADEMRLPDGDELPMLWRNSYFLDSLKAVTRQLNERR